MYLLVIYRYLYYRLYKTDIYSDKFDCMMLGVICVKTSQRKKKPLCFRYVMTVVFISANP